MWVVDMEKKLDGAEPPATWKKWSRHCIFRVPPRFRTTRGNVFKPQTVALGPFHHRDPDLVPMEEHKRRAVWHLLRRAGRALPELAAAVEGVAVDLEDAYAGLGPEWRAGEENRGRFLEMMVADGCFLLEVMRGQSGDYPPGDPVFGEHAVRHIKSFVQRDMLMVENQLPLLLLHRISSIAESTNPPSERSINKQVLEFLCIGDDCAAKVHVPPELGLHPLDLYRRSLLRCATATSTPEIDNPEIGSHRNGERICWCLPLPTTRPMLQHRSRPCCTAAATEQQAPRRRAPPRSAQQLCEAGIRFKPSDTVFLDDVRFDMGTRVLNMPELMLDDSTEYRYQNVMAFEALHAAGADNHVTAFVLFVRDMIDSAADVALLGRKRILKHDLAGGDAAVVRLFERLTRDVAKIGRSRLCGIRKEVERYCDDNWRVSFFRSLSKLKNTYFTSPWTFIALVVSVFFLATDAIQTVYAVMSYVLAKSEQHG